MLKNRIKDTSSHAATEVMVNSRWSMVAFIKVGAISRSHARFVLPIKPSNGYPCPHSNYVEVFDI